MKKAKVLFSEDKRCAAELIIHVDCLISNINEARNLVGTETKIMFVVKNSAYGFGAIHLTKILEERQIVDYFGVANSDEGRELRKADINLPILVLNPTTNSFPDLVKFDLEAEVYSISFLKKLMQYLKENKPSNLLPFPVHLKFNTGMNRLGINKEEVSELIKILDQDVIEIKSLMTHLSSASIPSEDEFTIEQLANFEDIIAILKKNVSLKNLQIHVLNSSGSLRFSKNHYQMIRLGILGYGGVKSNKASILPTIEFKTKVIQIRRVLKGESISYNRSGKAKKDSNIASIAIGYGDGFRRSLGNGKWEVEINGKLYPTVGNICMDLTMIDIGEDTVNVDDDVTLFGGKKSLFDYSDALETITYEALTSLSSNIKRTYIESI